MRNKYSLTLFMLVFSLLTLSCGSETGSEVPSVANTEQATTIQLPKLLDRHPNLRQGKEWDEVQSLFVQFRNNIQQGKKTNEARLQMAQLFVNEARVTGEHGHYYPAALEVLDAGLGDHKLDKDLRFRLLSTKASILLSLHQFKKGLEVGEEALALNSHNSGIYGILIDANVELGNYEKAVELADQMVAIRPDLRSYARISYLREIHGDWQGAIEAMQMAVKAGFPGMEQTSWTRLTLGKLYAEYGDTDQAAKQFEIVLANRPDYPFAIAELARLDMEKGNYQQAEASLKKAAAIMPEFSFFQDLAEIYLRTGRSEEFDETVKYLLTMLNEDEAAGHRMDLEKSIVYAKLLKDYDRALATAHLAYQERPNNIDVNRTIAKILIEAGQSEKAKPYVLAAAITNSQKPEFLQLQQSLAMK
ncbi:MAG: tetratricopeptide repeat protein [Saprospiraceae bacterium]|nr:tetratricopeptide repeat protein [Lewinella sp.]